MNSLARKAYNASIKQKGYFIIHILINHYFYNMNLEPKKEGVNNIFPDLNAAMNNIPDTSNTSNTSKSIGAGNATPLNFMPKEDRFYDPANLASNRATVNDPTETPLPEKSMVNVFGNAPMVTKKKISKKTITIIAVIFLLLAAATGIIIVKGEELGILRSKPEKVLSQMIENMNSVKTSHLEGNGQITASNSATPGQSLNMGFKITADEDATIEDNPKANLNYDLNFALEGMSFTGNFDFTIVDKIAYFRLNKAPMLPFIDLGKFKGKWIKADPKEIEKVNPSFAESLDSLDSSKEMNVKINEIVKKYQNNLVKIKNELPDEKVNNVNVYSYALTVNKETMRQFFKEVMDLSQELNQTKLPSSVTSIEDYKKMQEKLLGMIIDFAADKAETKILIGKKDKMLYGISFKIDIDGKDIGELVTAMSKEIPNGISTPTAVPKEIEGLTANLVFDIRYSNFNEPVNIKAPENAEDFMEALGIEDSLGAAKKKANDAKRISEINTLKLALTMYHNENGSYPVTQGMEKTNDKNSAIYKLINSSKYITTIPVDPLDPNYFYGYKSDGKIFELSARLENLENTQCKKISPDVCLYILKDK